MQRNTNVISISLTPEVYKILERMAEKTAKSRSEIIKDLLITHNQNKSWEQIFAWGRNTREKFNIKSEEDIVKIIND